jgi:Na+-translocating ferredoxin:NAD+ oxidoreductase RnfG subunit
MSFLSKSLLLFCFLCCFFRGETQEWSPALKGKIQKALAGVYETEQIRYEAVEIDEAIRVKAPLKDHFFRVFANDTFKGYAYVAQAPSMKNVFDYLVIFNTDLAIEKAKVLIYREQHGRQIGTARWLNQFKGMTTMDKPELGKGVDGISGATISAKSMTVAVNELLTSLSIAKVKGIL